MWRENRVLLVLVTLSMALVITDTLSPCVSKLCLARSREFDVIVVGTDPEGISAAVSSARNGMKTLLVDGRDRLGGLWTLGGLNFIDMNFDPDGRLLTRGIFEEFYKEINRRDPQPGSVESFDTQLAEAIFERMVDREPNLVCRIRTPVIRVLKHGDRVTGVVVNDAGVVRTLRAKRVIDATQDGDIAAMAGAQYFVGMADFHQPDECQPMTLVFEMDGVDWEKLARSLENLHNPRTGGADHMSAWGFLKKTRAYRPTHKNMAIRGLNIARLRGKRVLVNSLLVMGVRPLDERAKRRAMRDSREELRPLAGFIHRRIPGFAHARLIGGMPEMYVRESRHLVALYRLTVNDLIENRDFPDKIAMGCYALDVQKTSADNFGFVLGKPAGYSIPFRCLVPKGVEGLLVVGRSAGFDSLAHSSARVVSIGMATGQAAGVACYYSIREHTSFAEMSRGTVIGQVQQRLRRQGAYLERVHYPIPYEGHWALESIRFLRGLGLVVGGYRNDYKLDEAVSSQRVINMAVKAETRLGIRRQREPQDVLWLEQVSAEQAGQLLLHLLGEDYRAQRPLAELVKLGAISEATAAKVSKMRRFNNAGLFLMLQDYLGKGESGVSS